MRLMDGDFLESLLENIHVDPARYAWNDPTVRANVEVGDAISFSDADVAWVSRIDAEGLWLQSTCTIVESTDPEHRDLIGVPVTQERHWSWDRLIVKQCIVLKGYRED